MSGRALQRHARTEVISPIGAEFLAHRLATETFLRGVDLLNESVGGNIALGMLLNALWCLELRKTIAPAQSLILPPTWNAPMSIHDLARALDVPYSTTYRQLKQLNRRGMAAQVEDGGFVIAPAFTAGTAGRRLRAASIASSTRLLLGLHRIGFVSGSVAALERERLTGEQEDVVFRVAMETILCCLLITAKSYDDLVMGLVFKLVATGNIKHLIGEVRTVPIAQPVPDELRRPVSIYKAARSLHMPYETTRRIARQLLARNAFRQDVNGGLVVPSQVHGQTENAEAQQAGFQVLAASIAQLSHAGLKLRPTI